MPNSASTPEAKRRIRGYGPEMPLNAPVPGLIARNRREGNQTVYRFAVPWKSLNVKPAAQMPLGISVLFNDRDEARDRHLHPLLCICQPGKIGHGGVDPQALSETAGRTHFLQKIQQEST